MKALEIHLVKEYEKAFLLYHEKKPFSRWHYHPEYELVLILNGAGKRMVGDHIARFEQGDLAFLGPNLPHEWLCDDVYYNQNLGFWGEGLVIQFSENFLGETFFQIAENRKLKNSLQIQKEVFCLKDIPK